jgi:hypothetical protein
MRFREQNAGYVSLRHVQGFWAASIRPLEGAFEVRADQSEDNRFDSGKRISMKFIPFSNGIKEEEI